MAAFRSEKVAGFVGIRNFKGRGQTDRRHRSPLFQPDIGAPSARVIVVAPSQIVVVTTVLRVETHDRLDGHK
jgi:hypothetical protein